MYWEDARSLMPVLALVMGIAAMVFGAGPDKERKHPVLDHGIDVKNAAGYEKAVARAMGMSEEDLLSLVPDKPFTAYCECPNCYGGVEGNHIFAWSIDRPNEMKCRFCGTVFPNEKYPEHKTLAGANKPGETISFKYHYSEQRQVAHFLTGNLRRWHRDWITLQIVALGKAYHVTGKAEYAARVVLVLDRLAQVYPHYPAMQNGPRRFTFLKSQDPPFPWDGGRWGHFHNEIPRPLVEAYDLVHDSEEFDKLSQKRGYNVRKNLEEDFLKVAFHAATEYKQHVSNVIGYDVASAALLGRVIHEPRYVHWAFGWMRQTVDAGFFHDGMWHESPSYHYMTVGGLKSAFNCVKGYSDPPAYTDAVDGTRFDNLQPETDIPFFARVLHTPELIDLPNGCSAPVHDTHPYERRSKPRDKTVSAIVPGYGHASLGRGAGPNQMQAQLHFSGSYGHAHYDNLNLALWAKQREMLPDLGYTWTQMRYWCTCTAGHNTVVVDRTDQQGRASDGDLLWFFPNVGGVSVVEADGRRGYANTKDLDRYRRLLVMIPVSESDAYVVDCFRARGGAMHDWALHGDADRDMTARCSLPLEGNRTTMLEAGEEWVEPTIEGAKFNPYGMMRNMQQAKTDGGFQVNFDYVEEPARGIRLHMLSGGATEVWLGKSPSVRRMGQGSSGDMRKAYDFWMPQLLVRRQGQAPLAGTFAAVHEPYLGAPFLGTVESLQLTPPDENALGIRVVHGNTTDTIISTLDAPPYPERATPDAIHIKGRLGIVRQVEGKVVGAWLFEGERLAGDGWTLDPSESRYGGRITGATRKADRADQDAFLTDAALPEGNALHGAWLIVTHGNEFTHGCEIERVEKRGGETAIVLTMDHGLKIDGNKTEEVFFPQRKIDGANTFVIPLAATLKR